MLALLAVVRAEASPFTFEDVAGTARIAVGPSNSVAQVPGADVVLPFEELRDA